MEPQSITVNFLRNLGSYQKSSVSYAATQAQVGSFVISSDSTAVNAQGPATIEITTTLTIPSGSYLEIIYHSSIVVSNSGSTAVTSASIEGILVSGVTYSVSSNTITILNLFSSNGTGSISITLPNFVNPPTLRPITYSMNIKSGTNYMIAASSYTFTASLQALVSNSISASSYTVMQSSVTYTMTFTSNYGFKAISFLIPADVSVVSGF